MYARIYYLSKSMCYISKPVHQNGFFMQIGQIGRAAALCLQDAPQDAPVA